MKTAEEEKRHAEIWRQLRSTTELHAASWQRLQAWRARLPHALLLSGARGLGKQDLARAFAASLLCESPKINGSACGECAACHWFEQGNHPDFRMLTKEVSMKAMDKEKSVKAGVSTDKDEKEEKSNRSGQEIIIDRVRELDEFFAVGSHRQKSRIILIYPAESLNAAAANAILKVLEEPPANTLFLLVSNEPIHVGIEGASSLLTAGDHLVLIGATATRSTLMATQGISLLYTFDLSVDGVTNQLIASLPSALPPPMTPPPVPRL
ncbi:hypothetical protein FACS189441_2010 [Betaproteobacteria bacterium]|nr:hypothetical protein FACS189441_2010 [Betaproteobacteria bacterium]